MKFPLRLVIIFRNIMGKVFWEVIQARVSHQYQLVTDISLQCDRVEVFEHAVQFDGEKLLEL